MSPQTAFLLLQFAFLCEVLVGFLLAFLYWYQKGQSPLPRILRTAESLIVSINLGLSAGFFVGYYTSLWFNLHLGDFGTRLWGAGSMLIVTVVVYILMRYKILK